MGTVSHGLSQRQDRRSGRGESVVIGRFVDRFAFEDRWGETMMHILV